MPQKSSLIFPISLCGCTQICTFCKSFDTKTASLRFLFDCLNTSGLYWTQQNVSLSLVHRAQSKKHTAVHTRSHTQVVNYGWHTDTGMIHLSHLYIYTKSGFQRLSLFIPPRVHILSLDICSGVHDGPQRWCLTAATLNQDSVGADTERAAPEDHWGCPSADELGAKCCLLDPKSSVSQASNSNGVS